MLGLALVGIGLLTTALAFVSEGGDGEGWIIIFPFVFGRVSGWAAAIFTIMFFIVFILSSVLPWYLISRRGHVDGGFTTIYREGARDMVSETMEYIITTELPARLRRSIYIETDNEEVRLRSSLDRAFNRKYTLPRGFTVEDIDYDYEGDYFLLKLILKRTN